MKRGRHWKRLPLMNDTMGLCPTCGKTPHVFPAQAFLEENNALLEKVEAAHELVQRKGGTMSKDMAQWTKAAGLTEGEEPTMALTQKGVHYGGKYGQKVLATIGGQHITAGELADIMEVAYWALHTSGHYEDVAGYLDVSNAKLEPLRKKVVMALQ